MSKTKLGTIAIAAAATMFGLAITSGTGNAWSWGSEDMQNYEFAPQHRDEILRYQSRIGANWAQETKDSAYASKQASGVSSSNPSAYRTEGQTSKKATN